MTIAPMGEQLEVQAGFYNVNFHYDILRFFLKVQECNSLEGIQFFSSLDLWKKLQCPMCFF
jgi:hypothetical protein